MVENAVPLNIRQLWKAQDDLMPWAEKLIAEEEYLVDHLASIELYLDAIDFARQQQVLGERHYAIFGLFLRTFDSLHNGLRASLSGNYTGAAMYARDLLETHFLVDYLLEDDNRPLHWLRADEKTLKDEYKQVKIRDSLDKRDGFQGLKRRDHYSLLSNYGSHPTPQSFELKKASANLITSGPFQRADLAIAMVQELAKITLLLSTILNIYLTEIPQTETYQAALLLRLQKSKSLYFSDSSSD
jgi:hypothetical protein